MIRKITTVLTSVLVIFLFTNSMVSASSLSLTITVQVDQTSGRQVAELINEFRTGGDAWYWNEDNVTKTQTGVLPAYQYDYGLEQIAIQRASELILAYNGNHSRPDGSSCYSCTYGSAITNGECAAIGSETAAEVVERWKEENDNYSGQGHRRNMLMTEMTAIGAAHVIYNGHHYWVFEISIRPSGISDAGAYNGPKEITLNTDSSICNLTLSPSSKSLYLGYNDSTVLPELTAGYKTSSTPYEGIPVSIDNVSDITWTSNDTSILTINGDRYRAVGVGNTTITITGTYEGRPVSSNVSVNVSSKNISYSNSGITVTVPDVTYTGEAPHPVPTVMQYEDVLTEGVDYTVSYTDVSAGMSYTYLTINGIGNYTGSVREYFFINPADINDCELGNIAPVELTGDHAEPVVNFYMNGKKLVYGTDFLIDYENGVCNRVGTGMVYAYGIGNFQGYKLLTFKIVRSGTLKTPVRVASRSLALQGYILINYYLDLPQEFIDAEGAQIIIGDTTYSVSDANLSTDGLYIFSYGVASGQMRDIVTLKSVYGNDQLYPMIDNDGNDVTSGSDYSVQTYIDRMISKYADNSAYTKLITLLRYMNEYGSYAQVQFNYNPTEHPDFDADIKAEMDAVSADRLEQYKNTTVKNGDDKISYGGSSVVLESATEMRFYFSLKNGATIDDYTFTVDGREITTTTTGDIRLVLNPNGEYSIEIKNIAVAQMDKMYTISVVEKSSGTEKFNIEYCVLSYAYNKVNKYEQGTETNVDLINAVRSMYLYHVAAEDFFGDE